MSEADFDLVALNELKDIMADDFCVLVDAFVSDGAIKIDLIHQACAEKDVVEFKNLGHSLKGSSGNLGAVTLAGFCKTLEGMGDSGDCEGVDDLVLEIDKAYVVAKDYLMSLL